MAYRKNYNKNTNRNSPTKINKESLQSEALIIYTLKTESDETLEKPTEEFCYLISQKWWDSYETYIGYNEVIEEKPLKKSFGQKFPGPMNDDMLCDQEKMFKIPAVLEQLDYLSLFLRSKVIENEAYIIVDSKLWEHLYGLYGGKAIRRPLRHDYSYATCDNLQKSHVVLLTHDKVKELLNDQNSKKSRVSSVLGGFKNIQFHETWRVNDLKSFFNEILEAETGKSHWEVKIWRLNNYLFLDDFWKSFEEFLLQFEELQKFFIEAKELTQPRFENILLEDLLKSGYYLIIEAKNSEEEEFWFEEYKLSAQNIKELKGYCEFCDNKDDFLLWTCLCKEVFYCCEKCKYKDQHFHYKICAQSYDSDSDNEEETKENNNFHLFLNDRGLKNLGNTCYMNSVLQAFKRTSIPKDLYYYNNYVKKIKEKKNEENNKFLLTRKFSKLMKKMSSEEENDPVAPWSLKQTFSLYYPNFKGYRQHDSQEFISYLMNALHEEISLNQIEENNSKKIDYSDPDQYIDSSIQSSCSRFSELFQGLFSSEIRCPICQHFSTQYDQFNMVSLPISSKEDYYNLPIVFIPCDITSEFLEKVYQFSLTNNTLLEEFHSIVRKDLNIPNEKDLLFVILLDDDVVTEVLQDKSLELKEIKTKLESKRKRLVLYEMPKYWDMNIEHLIYINFTTEVKKPSGISFKKNVGLPRPILIQQQPLYEDIYLSIMGLFAEIYPDHQAQFQELKNILSNQKLENNENSEKEKKTPSKEEIIKTNLNEENGNSNQNLKQDKEEKIVEKNDSSQVQESNLNSKLAENQEIEEEVKVEPKNSATQNKGKKKKPPRVSKRKKGAEKQIKTQVKEEPPKQTAEEKNKENSPAKELQKEKPEEKNEELFEEFIMNLPYSIKFINKMKNIHSCLLCNKKNCDSCPISLNKASCTLIELLDRCKINQVPFELNVFFPKDLPKCLEKSIDNHSSNLNQNTGVSNSNPTLLQCLELFSEKEVLSSENMWFCPQCQEKKQAEKTIRLYYVSKYLIFHLKRFKSVEGSKSKKVKNTQPIDYPINELDLTPYVNNLVPHLRALEPQKIVYKLISVVLHEGKLDEGHYTALGRCSDGSWKKFDDDKVQEVNQKEVCHKNAYLLFYELY